MCTREARQGGRPGHEYTVTYMEAGLCRRPYSRHQGSPALREAYCKDQHVHGSRSMPEASVCVQGKPDKARGLFMNMRQHTWKPFHAGGHIVDVWDARRSGRPGDPVTLPYTDSSIAVTATGQSQPQQPWEKPNPRHALQSPENIAQPRVSTTLV